MFVFSINIDEYLSKDSVHTALVFISNYVSIEITNDNFAIMNNRDSVKQKAATGRKEASYFPSKRSDFCIHSQAVGYHFLSVSNGSR